MFSHDIYIQEYNRRLHRDLNFEVCQPDELITRSEESYRQWCVVECDIETS